MSKSPGPLAVGGIGSEEDEIVAVVDGGVLEAADGVGHELLERVPHRQGRRRQPEARVVHFVVEVSLAINS